MSILLKIQEWIMEHWPEVWTWTRPKLLWIALIVGIVNSIILFDLLRSHYIFGGVTEGWPDAIVCLGQVGSGDSKTSVSIYYLTHSNHNMNRDNVVGYRMISREEYSIYFDTATKTVHMPVDKIAKDSDCAQPGMTISRLIDSQRGIYFPSGPRPRFDTWLSAK
jgi:hypothetical protein